MSEQMEGGAGTAVAPPPGNLPPPPPDQPQGELGGKGRKQKQKKEKVPKMKAAKAPRSARTVTERGIPLFSMSDEIPNRGQQEQEAAAELMAAIGPSMELLRHEVPDASSPDDAYRKIESKLGPAVSDPDPNLPKHPQYTGDSLVYYQLRRHYGSPNPGGTFQRSWYPLGPGS